MLRTFALTYAAVTLRLWLGVLLAWVPNLLLAEWLLRRQPADDRLRTPAM